MKRARIYPLLLWLLLAGWTAAPRAMGQQADAPPGPSKGRRVHRTRSMGQPTEPSNTLGAAITTGNQIDYHGGPVLLGTTNVYYIWYGNWDATSIAILTNLASRIGGSPYFDINTGYFDGTGASVSNAVAFAGSAQDAYSRGKSLRDSDIWRIVTSALSAGSLPIDSNGVYFVLTASDALLDGFGGSFCGWHTEQIYQTTSIRYAFVGNPNPSALSGCAHQTSSPNGDAGADAMANIVAHELEEAVTDPAGNAWFDSNSQENADKCAWKFGTTYTALNGSKANMSLGGRDYLIQQNWVNSSSGFCAMSASPGSDFALSATVSSQTASPGNDTGQYTVTIVPVKGFSSTVSFSISGLPAGATASPINPSTTGATFTISTSFTLGGGTYPFTISGSSGSITHTASGVLLVNGPVLSPVVITMGTIRPEPSQVGQAYSVSYSVTSSVGIPTGIVSVTDGAAVCSATVAAGSCALTSTTAGIKVITMAYSGDSQFGARARTKLHSVTNGGALAHLASGAGWETTFGLINLGSTSASMSLSFLGDSGGALNLPFTFPQSLAAPLNTSSVSQSLGSNAMLLLDTSLPVGQALSQGWANMTSTGNVNAYQVFRYAPSGQEAVAPLETRNASSYIVMFDNTSLVNALGTGVAIANLASQAASIAVIVRDDAGAQIANASVPVAALGHIAFTLADRFPVTSGKRGTVEFSTPAGGRISVLAIRANGNAFTTIPVIASGSAGGGAMAHIVSGGGWRSVFSVLNPGTTSADIVLSFFDDGGNPLALPLTFLQTGASSTASTVTRTLAAGASLIVQSQGLTSQVVLGSAQLTTTGNAGGFVVFRYDPSGQEATAPLENRNAGAYVLAFDNTAPLATGVALANLSSQDTSVGMILRDDKGATLQTATIPLAANGHFAFVLGGNYPLAAGKRGTVEFTSSGVQISVLGIRANGNAFTSIPVLTR